VDRLERESCVFGFALVRLLTCSLPIPTPPLGRETARAGKVGARSTQPCDAPSSPQLPSFVSSCQAPGSSHVHLARPWSDRALAATLCAGGSSNQARLLGRPPNASPRVSSTPSPTNTCQCRPLLLLLLAQSAATRWIRSMVNSIIGSCTMD
jgi:hypothetical protein